MRKTVYLAMTAAVIVGLAACDRKAATPTAATDASAAAPANAPGRLRGTLASVTPNALGVTTYDGTARQVALTDRTNYAWVVQSSLDTLKNGDFIGTATTGPDSDLRAVEIVIFPAAMRGNGEGHYGWDTPGIVQAAGQAGGPASATTNGTVTQSAMTNGTVTQSALTNGTVTRSAMTNGTVTQSAMTNGTVTTGAGAGAGGAGRLTVSYKGGSAQVTVPAGTPVVRFEPTTRASLAKGGKLFVKLADDDKTAQFVAIGKDGLTPPM